MAKKPAAKVAPKTVQPSGKLTEFTAGAVKDAVAAAGGKSSNKLVALPVDSIHVMPGFNLRVTDAPDYQAALVDLKDSILLEGFYPSKPLSVFAAEIDGEITTVLVDGHRRLAAVKMAIAEGADIEMLPVVYKAPTSTDLDLAVALEKENASRPLSMYERAVLCHRMMKAGEDEDAVAARLNVTVRHVNDLKVLIAAPKAVRDLIKAGRISATEAVAQLRKEGGAEKIIEAAEKAAEKAKKAADDKAARQDARVTRQSIEDGGAADDGPKVKMVTIRNNFQVTEGSEFSYEDAAPFLTIIGDETWFKNARKKTNRIALETISVEVKIRRPKQEDAEDAGVVEEEIVLTAAQKKAADKAAAKAAKTAEEAGLDDDFDDAPDLASLGIADRADTSAEL